MKDPSSNQPSFQKGKPLPIPGNLILIGFMGSGKTSVGRRVATNLGFRFVDTDELIAAKAGKSIPDIFADSGEDAFRLLESEVLAECVKKTGQVISTGGGIILSESNRLLLRESGYVIWLRTSAEVILDRVSRSNDRPLLATEDPAATISKLLKERYPLYESVAHLPITTDELTLEETIYGVAESARIAFQQNL